MRIAVLAAVATAPLYAQAQSLKLEGKDKPIDVTADQGFELQQDSKRMIARGNAKAVQGDVTVTSDELTADYREKAGGGNEVYRVFANGNVTMKSNTETATGDSAVYDFDKGVLVMEGKVVTLVNPEGTVTAKRALQYWSNDHVAVAEGSAVAVDKQNRKLFGDKLIAFFREDEDAGAPGAAKKTTSSIELPQGKGDIILLQGFGNVRMETEKEIVRGERGNYNIDTGIATLEGNVKITQNNSELSGGFAVVHVDGGTSRIFTSAKQASMPGVRENPRVSALVAPKSKEETDAATSSAPASPAQSKGQK
jgi:lipopolysaccharide export system protein LptA